MNQAPLTLAHYPSAILHIDGDAFFTSVEQALEPSLRNRPVVTGQERGIIACASYEAKARGIQRGVPLFLARKRCPELVILPSDYETYGIYSQKMFDIIRRFTPLVEEYSVDEAFADITGMRRVFRCSYEDMARRIQATIHAELGITVSVGLSLSKALAKICSDFRKPNGFTGVCGRHIHLLLQRTPLEDVWGFGHNTVRLLRKFGLHTAYDFVTRPEHWAHKLLHKPGRELWHELRGESLWPVSTEVKTAYATIVKSKTFTPATGDRDFVYAKLIRNVEAAFRKARRYRLCAGVLGIVLRHHDFHHDGLEARLSRPTASPAEALPLIRAVFDRIFRTNARYRSTMIVLGNLKPDAPEQYDLFEDRLKIDAMRNLTKAVDSVTARFGRHALCSGTALYLTPDRQSNRDAMPDRHHVLMRGEDRRRRLAIPRTALTNGDFSRCSGSAPLC